MSKPERFEDHPIQIIITKSGDLDFSHPLFSQSSLKIVIITTPNGAKTCKKNIEDFPKVLFFKKTFFFLNQLQST